MPELSVNPGQQLPVALPAVVEPACQPPHHTVHNAWDTWLPSACLQFSPSTRLAGGAAGVAALCAELDLGTNLVLVSGSGVGEQQWWCQ